MDKENEDNTVEYIMPLSEELVNELLYDVPESERTPAMIDEVQKRKATRIKFKKHKLFDEPMNRYMKEQEHKMFYSDTKMAAPQNHRMIFINNETT